MADKTGSSHERAIAMLHPVFRQVGANLFTQRLLAATSGNFSVRTEDGFIITRSGVLKGELRPGDLMSLSAEEDPLRDTGSSVERAVHREIYRSTDARAVVHAHPRFAVALSIYLSAIKPVDLEGQFHLPEVPILNPTKLSASIETAQAVAGALETYSSCILRGHGAFVKSAAERPADALVQAYSLMTILEESSEILYRSTVYKATLHLGESQ